ncbi:hypothetical protein AHAS_Ahas18G0109500 [Arachis hypogaea]
MEDAILLPFLTQVIVRQSVDKAEFQESSVEKILNLLFNHCESEEEGVRNMVAECLGKIALIEPAKLVPALKVRTTSPAAFIQATVVIAVKYSIMERREKIDEISSFLMLIKDNDSHVRRAVVLALSTFEHNKPNLIKGLLPDLLPLIYDQTIQELIRTVDLELRKAAFECVDTLLDSCLDQVLNSLGIMSRLINQDQDQEVKDMTTLALELYCTLMSDKRSSPSVGLAVRNKVLPQALTLIKSSLLQGQALLALQNFFAALVYSANTSFDSLLESLLASAKPSPQSSGIAKQACIQ